MSKESCIVIKILGDCEVSIMNVKENKENNFKEITLENVEEVYKKISY